MKTEKEEKRDLTRLASKKSKVTAKQKAGHKRQSENLKDRKERMIKHIVKKIGENYYSPDDFLDDPSVYMESQILGKYANNLIIQKSIVKAIEKHYGRTIPF